MLGNAIEGPAHCRRIGHVAFDLERRPAEPLACGRCALDIEHRDLGPGTAHRASRGKADRSRTAGDDGDLAGERLLGGLTEFSLL